MQTGTSRSVAVIYNPVERGGDALVRGVVDAAMEAHGAIEALGHRAALLRLDEGVRPFVDALDALRPDVVFNLCEGYRESSAGEYCVAGLLELLGIPYTGSGPIALGIALDKPLSKELFLARKIPTPRFAVYRDVPERLASLTYPVILKLASEDASLGITADNVVGDDVAARARLRQLMDQFGAPVLAEEFIDGREFTVALFDGTPLVVEEIVIDVEPRVVGFRAKWEAGSAEYEGTRPLFQPDLTDGQRGEMTSLATRVCDAIGIRDYARVDFRMDARGAIHVLEANPNPDISAGSGYRRSLDFAGISYPEFVKRLLEKALQRAPHEEGVRREPPADRG